MIYSKVAAVFRRHHSYLLLIHHSPDGDAVASSLALALALRAIGKEADVVCADPVPVQFSFLPLVQDIKNDFLFGDYDVVVTLDCGDSRRTGFRQRLKDLVRKKHKILINIDHHPKNDLHALATYNVVDYSAPSTSYLVYGLLGELGVQLDHRLATCLLTGLYTDTGGFKHPNTTPEALKFAALLLAHGARLKDITAYITQPSTVARLRLWGVALSRIQHHQAYDIVATYIEHADVLAAGATPDDIAGIATLLTSIPARIAMLVVYGPGGDTQVRLRTKRSDINLVPLATYFGGGGQKKAAGFCLQVE